MPGCPCQTGEAADMRFAQPTADTMPAVGGPSVQESHAFGWWVNVPQHLRFCFAQKHSAEHTKWIFHKVDFHRFATRLMLDTLVSPGGRVSATSTDTHMVS